MNTKCNTISRNSVYLEILHFVLLTRFKRCSSNFLPQLASVLSLNSFREFKSKMTEKKRICIVGSGNWYEIFILTCIFNFLLGVILPVRFGITDSFVPCLFDPAILENKIILKITFLEGFYYLTCNIHVSAVLYKYV
jgi:hypothetical protein